MSQVLPIDAVHSTRSFCMKLRTNNQVFAGFGVIGWFLSYNVTSVSHHITMLYTCQISISVLGLGNDNLLPLQLLKLLLLFQTLYEASCPLMSISIYVNLINLIQNYIIHILHNDTSRRLVIRINPQSIHSGYKEASDW